MLMAMAMSDASPSKFSDLMTDRRTPPKKRDVLVVPKGVKVFHFYTNGTQAAEGSEYTIAIEAINLKNAQRKFFKKYPINRR